MEQLSDALGDRHDLDVLRLVVDDSGFNEYDINVLRGLIDERIAALSARATEIGADVYADAPDALLNRFESYWTLWKPS
jgi:hypothetical protein